MKAWVLLTFMIVFLLSSSISLAQSPEKSMEGLTFSSTAYSLLSVVIIGAISLVGALTFSISMDKLRKVLLYFVSFSAGALMGDAFIHLLPEAVEKAGFTLVISSYILLGVAVSFSIEKLIHWRHCHLPTTKEHPHPFALMNLFGDAVHNFIDGLIVAASYTVSLTVGLATTVAVILHEIPQEIGDFGVLIHGGFTRKRALVLNLLTALTAIVGAVIGLLLGYFFISITHFLIPFAAGSFIYIAGSDLIPELNKEIKGGRKSATELLFFVMGIMIMATLLVIE